MKTILIFDLADVLIEGFDSFVKALSKRLSLPVTDVILGVGGAILVALTEGRISEVTYWQCVLERTHWPITMEELSARVRRIFRQPMPGMPELILSLRRHRLVLFSDQAREWWEDIAVTHAFIQVFEQRFLSFTWDRRSGRSERSSGCWQNSEPCLTTTSSSMICSGRWSGRKAWESAGIASPRRQRSGRSWHKRACGPSRRRPANKAPHLRPTAYARTSRRLQRPRGFPVISSCPFSLAWSR